MSWQLVGFTRGDGGQTSGVEFDLGDDDFDDAAIVWLGSGVRLSRALWPLPSERVEQATQLTGAVLDLATTDYYVLRRPQWIVVARRDLPEPVQIDYHLPDDFGFVQAAAWIGSWSPTMA